ncbi:RNA polymerase sigma-70 factor, ECF subfamily [Pedobacter steynii]|uniref:RNA polymerase sigma-70 factor, ECF subfamily n=1 Tax=Pedobacter steynii TaxID=430522 RepID=A0A1H0E5S2_9SPHI|nr:RNA polymerase sigma-70 factor [Pedobacter steynii]NQX41928.1 RNA polymerase sigma-70 factor [Pedobacter steynii]SDN77729.1 RNA polymerase sigma-70 factor, ECF subfamily [Pedobacter steynii]
MDGGDTIALLIEDNFFRENRENSVTVFSQLYRHYFKRLFMTALKVVRDEYLAEEVIQDVFLRLWENEDKFHLISEFEKYLYRSVANESLNKLRNQKTQSKHYDHLSKASRSDFVENFLEEEELKMKIAKAVETLPSQCKTVFKMSRYQGMKYRKIAEELNISEKTVEGHMVKALKILRNHLLGLILLVSYLNWVFGN